MLFIVILISCFVLAMAEDIALYIVRRTSETEETEYQRKLVLKEQELQMMRVQRLAMDIRTTSNNLNKLREDIYTLDAVYVKEDIHE